MKRETVFFEIPELEDLPDFDDRLQVLYRAGWEITPEVWAYDAAGNRRRQLKWNVYHDAQRGLTGELPAVPFVSVAFQNVQDFPAVAELIVAFCESLARQFDPYEMRKKAIRSSQVQGA